MDSELRDDLISTALDGERVDVDALRRALASDDGRKALASFVLLRAATANDEIESPVLAVEPAATTRGETGRLAATQKTHRVFAIARVPAAWAASLALAAALAFWFGTTLGRPITQVSLLAPTVTTAPFSPSVIVGPANHVEAAVSAGAGRAGAAPAHLAADQPPKPTRVLRFIPGVDWKSAAE